MIDAPALCAFESREPRCIALAIPGSKYCTVHQRVFIERHTRPRMEAAPGGLRLVSTAFGATPPEREPEPAA